MKVSFVLIPSDVRKAIETVTVDLSDKRGRDKDNSVGGDQLARYLQNEIEESGHKQEDQIQVTPLKRLSHSSSTDGIYAYYRHSNKHEADGNKRATTLSMACGLLSHRFFGDVYISRLGYFNVTPDTDINTDMSTNTSSGHGHGHGEEHRQLRNLSIALEEIELACIAGPDLRPDILTRLSYVPTDVDTNDANDANDANADCYRKDVTRLLPDWLRNAADSNYKDSASLSSLASVMKQQPRHQNTVHAHAHEETDSSSESEDSTIEIESCPEDRQSVRNTVTRVPLCLHCRRPADTLCTGCNGAYFCDVSRSCITDGWSHQSICKTWSLYTQRRTYLSKFPFKWHLPLMERECQLSDVPYRNYLTDILRVLPDEKSPGNHANLRWDTTAGSWWDTEVDGWEGGRSVSAAFVDPSVRHTYEEGFRMDQDAIPDERPVSDDDVTSCMIARDDCGLLRLKSWEDYYKIRRIPLTSPVALLCTFPLTVYYAIQRFGEVPITVAKMLKRPMRLHLIGIEKEMNFVDLFKEVGYLLPDDVMIEMLFIVRVDMVPPNCDCPSPGRDQQNRMRIELTPNLSLTIQSGTYAETINPAFDCGSGPPDMIIAMNAGLYAYKSWQSVIEYLRINSGVVGVFTDYNEHSGVNCAALGGGDARDSLCVNPFRQPLAMPVYSMNLPQFSNGFMYVYNKQELDM